MITFILRRLALMALTMLVVSLLLFLLLELTPGSVATKVLGPYATEEQKQLWLAANGYLEPVWSRYLSWLGRFATGTATSNFFICVGDQPYLDANPAAKGDNLGYAAFGRVVQGMPVVEKILSLPTNGETKFKDQRGQWLKPPVPITIMRRA